MSQNIPMPERVDQIIASYQARSTALIMVHPWGIDDGHGLRSMRERAQSAGGEVSVQSGPGGTTVGLMLSCC